MTGVQAVDKGTLEPIGFATSLKRNLPLLIPFAPLVAAVQMIKGDRLGDKWSNTRIIWRKHKGNPVFTGAELPEVADDYLPGQPMPNRPQSDNPFAAPIE